MTFLNFLVGISQPKSCFFTSLAENFTLREKGDMDFSPLWSGPGPYPQFGPQLSMVQSRVSKL